MNIQRRTIVILMILALQGILFLAFAFNSNKQNKDVVHGRIDLSREMIDTSTYSLDGEWEMAWNQLWNPDEFEEASLSGRTGWIHVPGSWNSQKIQGNKADAHGTATYRIRFLLPPSMDTMAIRIPAIHTAYTAWINGRPTGGVGRVGSDSSPTSAKVMPKILYFQPVGGLNELLLQVSNSADFKGGIVQSVRLGMAEQIVHIQTNKSTFDTFLGGTLFITGVYHIIFFILRRKDTASLYFGIICLFFVLRTMVTGEKYIYSRLPGLDWHDLLRLNYVSIYLCLPLYAAFLRELFPNEISKKAVRLASLLSILFGLSLLLPTNTLFTFIYRLSHFYIAGVVCYFSIRTTLALKHEKEGSMLFNLGGKFLALTVINDLLYYNELVPTRELSHIGLIVMIVFQSLTLSMKSSKTYSLVERMSEDLKELNSDLEHKITERTSTLEESRKQLQQANEALLHLSSVDGLTGISNRRHLDQYMSRVWHEDLHDGKPVTLILFDIDHFKAFNDTYGHLAGDDCLRKMAQAVQSALSDTDHLLARYGGEEFAVILKGLNREDALGMAECIRSTIESLQIPHEGSSAGPIVTASIGMAEINRSSNQTVKEWIEIADQNLYKAKQGGRNRVVGLETE
jgi:diguanylate cyclase (GGDEF)-like protein